MSCTAVALTGGGAGQNTRGRAYSPRPTAALPLGPLFDLPFVGEHTVHDRPGHLLPVIAAENPPRDSESGTTAVDTAVKQAIIVAGLVRMLLQSLRAALARLLNHTSTIATTNPRYFSSYTWNWSAPVTSRH